MSTVETDGVLGQRFGHEGAQAYDAGYEAGYAAGVAASKPKPRAKRQASGSLRTAKELALIAEGRPPFKAAIWFGPVRGWGYKPRKAVKLAPSAVGVTVPCVKRAYLAATGKTEVPAHDPAFGRR